MTLNTNVPTPAYNNVAIAPQFWIPSYFQIADITFGPQTEITVLPNFGRDCNFVVGQQVFFSIPQRYGTYELNGKKAVVTEIVDSLHFKINLATTSTTFTTFVPSPAGERQIAQVLPAGTFNTGNINPDIADVGLTIPGSFTNTQPYVV